MPAIFLYRLGPLLVVLHALCAVALCGAAVHQAVVAVLALSSKGGSRLRRLSRIYGLVSLLLYLSTAFFGALCYPRYRYFVRALFLDRHAPWASNLFDFKENLATLGLPLCVGAYLLSGSALPLPQPGGQASTGDRQVLILYAFFSLSTAAIAVGNTVAGLLCTSVRGL